MDYKKITEGFKEFEKGLTEAVRNINNTIPDDQKERLAQVMASEEAEKKIEEARKAIKDLETTINNL